MRTGGRWPMLTRVLAVMMAGVLAVQFANFAVLQLASLPEPPVFTAAQVAAVLRAGRDAGGEFRLEAIASPPASAGPHAARSAALLAHALGIAPDAVRAAFVDPPFLRFGLVQAGGPPRPPG